MTGRIKGRERGALLCATTGRGLFAVTDLSDNLLANPLIFESFQPSASSREGSHYFSISSGP